MKVHLNLNIDNWQAFRAACLAEGISLNNKIRELIENFLKEKEGSERASNKKRGR